MHPYKTGFPGFRIEDEAGYTIWLRKETILSGPALAQRLAVGPFAVSHASPPLRDSSFILMKLNPELDLIKFTRLVL
jgi:hypothetical protein